MYIPASVNVHLRILFLPKSQRNTCLITVFHVHAAEEQGSESQPWQALGMSHSPLLDYAQTALTSIPELLRKDVWGPLDVLLALAGHLQLGKQQQVRCVYQRIMLQSRI